MRCQQCLSLYSPDFDKTLKVGYWEHLEHILNFIGTFVYATFVLTRPHLSISGVSRLLLTRFWWDFKGRFLEPSLTDANSQGDICPGNICPGDICPYQQYLSCYWPDFDQTFVTQFLGGLNVLFDYTPFLPKCLWARSFCGPKILWSKILIFLNLNSFWPTILRPNYSNQKVFGP